MHSNIPSDHSRPDPCDYDSENVLLPLDGISVLVVDDDATIREVLVDVLTLLGATVIAEASAEEALDTLIRDRPEVLLSDISMPDRDGFWLIAQVRALPAQSGRDTPAVAITGHFALEKDRETVLRAGFQAYVPKPFSVDQLVRAVLLARASDASTVTGAAVECLEDARGVGAGAKTGTVQA